MAKGTKLIEVVDKFQCKNGKIYTETMTIEMRLGEAPEQAVRRVIKEFNQEELRRAKINPGYPVDTRAFISLESVKFSDLILHDWEKSAGYINGLPPYICKNTGLMEVSEWPPAKTIAQPFVCNICNGDFSSKDEYDRHLELESHLYCKFSKKPYPFFDDKFKDLITDEEYEEDAKRWEQGK